MQENHKIPAVSLKKAPAAKLLSGAKTITSKDYIFLGGANDGWWFAADRILVKHDNDYRKDRIDDAENRGQSDKSSDS